MKTQTENDFIYLDNAATTWPKPEVVYSAMDFFYRKFGFNANRGSSKIIKKSSELVTETRELLCELFGGKSLDKIIFTPSLTIGLNVILQGVAYNKGDIIYTTKYEHNAVVRTLNSLKKKYGIIIKELPLSDKFEYDIKLIKQIFEKEKVKLVVLNHASNVFGLITPVKEIFEIAKNQGVITVLDSAQSGGILDINVVRDKIDFLIFSGHKSLYGPFGIAGIIVNSNIKVMPLIYGGTGSHSELVEMPEENPQRYEAGSLNIQAISGLNASLKWLKETGIKKIYEHDMQLFDHYLKLMKKNEKIINYVTSSINKYVPVLSFNLANGQNSNDNYRYIEDKYKVIARSGLHCSPAAHKLIGTLKAGGTIRLSFSYFSKKDKMIEKMINEL